MKSLSHYLIPDRMYDTVYSIPFSEFYEKGIRVIVFDIDNTLVPYSILVPDERIKNFLFSVREMGFEIAFVSNNTPQRVETFNEPLGFFAVPDAHKPEKRALSPVLAHFGVTPSQLLFVGDQLLTDVLSARVHGAMAVTVSPIEKVESRFFRFKRFLEKPFIRAYRRREEKWQ